MFLDLRMLCLAAVFVALRVAVKLLTLPMGPDLHIAVDFLVNALGSAIYGPLMGLACGALTDTISAVCFPVGGYFFPFIFVEMTGSFLFGLFLWDRKITANRLILSKFAITFVCNIVMNTGVLLWMYAWLGNSKSAKALFVPRAVKNLALFPAECFLLIAFFAALLPAVKRLGIYKQPIADNLKMQKKQWILLLTLLILAILAVGAVVWYYLVYLKK
jgi:ECF transporter S component (folate family)